MSDITRDLVDMEMQAGAPHSQEAICRLAARVAIHKHGVPRDDDEFRDAALGGARGLFGPAFEAADYDQQQVWVDMYEDALREVSAQAAAN